MSPSTITLLCLSSFVPTRVVERPCSSVYSRLFLTLNEQFFMPYNYFLSIRFTYLHSSSTSNSFVILFRCLSTPNFPNVSCLFLCLLKLTGSLPTLSLCRIPLLISGSIVTHLRHDFVIGVVVLQQCCQEPTVSDYLFPQWRPEWRQEYHPDTNSRYAAARLFSGGTTSFQIVTHLW